MRGRYDHRLMTTDLCWSCQRRPAVPGYAARVRLHKHLGYSPAILGVDKQYLETVVVVPLCRPCGRAWPASNVFYGVTGCSGCLVVVLLIVGAITAIRDLLWSVAAGIAVVAAVIAVLVKWYEIRHRPKETGLRHPHTYPEVGDLVNKGYKIQN